MNNLRIGHDPLSHSVQFGSGPDPRAPQGQYPCPGRKPLFYSTLKMDPAPHSQASSSPQQENLWRSIPGRLWHYPERLRNPQGLEYEENPNINPYTMDDPSFPERWRIPPGNVLQNWCKHWDLGKLWKQSDQIAVFEGSINRYLRWAPTFYEMVHIQPMPWAYKLNILAEKLAPKVASLVIGGLAFEKKRLYSRIMSVREVFRWRRKDSAS